MEDEPDGSGILPASVATRDPDVILLDGSAYIFRAFYALPALTRASDGAQIGALAGFCNILWKLITQIDNWPNLKHIAVCFDPPGGTFRSKIYPEYKQNRKETPSELISQIPFVKQATEAFSIQILEASGFEADDVMASYAASAEKLGLITHLYSSDKDLMQMVSDKTFMFDPMKSRLIGRAEVVEKFGVDPELVTDVQGLAGDPTDNIPGVPGIGIKTAAPLINEYSSLENLLDHAHEIKQPKRRQALIDHRDDALISKELATLDREAPQPVPLADIGLVTLADAQKNKKLLSFTRSMSLNTLTKRIASHLDKINHLDAGTSLSLIADDFSSRPASAERSSDAPSNSTDDTSASEQLTRNKELLAQIDNSAKNYREVKSASELEAWINQITTGEVAILVTHDNHPVLPLRTIRGIALCSQFNDVIFVPFQSKHNQQQDIFSQGKPDTPQTLDDKSHKLLSKLLAGTSLTKIVHDAKTTIHCLQPLGLSLSNFEDVELMSYALDAGRAKHDLVNLAQTHLGIDCQSDYDLIKEAAQPRSGGLNAVPQQLLAESACLRADCTLRLKLLVAQRLAGMPASVAYSRLCKPLVKILATAESNGILVDAERLKSLSKEFAGKIAQTAQAIHELAGEEFNIASPAALGTILFDKLGYTGGKKTANGNWSTDAKTLDGLTETNPEFINLILDWRGLSKLKSTYADALPKFINPDSQRLHTNYAIALVTTGRLSSSDPNLQNIPIRTEQGRRIRNAFIAPPGTKLLCADYSQIELRILAHIANIPSLKTAFKQGEDIHALTASQIWGVDIANMTSDMRRAAKAVNFGIIYGISAFGLARQLSIANSAAREIIEQYFEKFPEIKDYMEACKVKARDVGYVETLFGRRCHYPAINSSNHNERNFNERACINAPIQGSAADIIARAMVHIDREITSGNIDAKLLLQVHDELVLEVPDEHVERVSTQVSDIMARAAFPILQSDITFEVNTGYADNWEQAH